MASGTDGDGSWDEYLGERSSALGQGHLDRVPRRSLTLSDGLEDRTPQQAEQGDMKLGQLKRKRGFLAVERLLKGHERCLDTLYSPGGLLVLGTFLKRGAAICHRSATSKLFAEMILRRQSMTTKDNARGRCEETLLNS